MAKYLLTGVAGFIGSRTAEMLLKEGHQVVGLDNLNDAYDIRLKHWRLNRIKEHAGLTFHEVDIANKPALEAVAGGESFDAVINLAARAGVRQSVENPWVYVDTNTTGTLNLLDLSCQLGIKKFVLASTSSLYGMHNPQPFSEDADTNKPLSPYAASKKGAEAMCYSYHHLFGIDVTIFRYFTVYGPAGRPDMSLFRFTQWIYEEKPLQLFGDGGSRDFSYVDDIARGTILGLKPVGYDVFNLGSDRPFEIKEVIRLIEGHAGKKAIIEQKPRHPADVPATWANITKAKTILGWEPQVTLEEGVANLVAWYEAERSWASRVETG